MALDESEVSPRFYAANDAASQARSFEGPLTSQKCPPGSMLLMMRQSQACKQICIDLEPQQGMSSGNMPSCCDAYGVKNTEC